jgi:dihydrofolate reductase
MRKIVMFNRVTADGFFAGADGNLDWVVPDREVDRKAIKSMGQFDTVLFGRRTYELFESFWPSALDSSPKSPDPHNNRALSPEMRSMALFLNEASKIVFSKTMKEAKWKNTRLVRSLNPGEIEELKKGPGKDILLFGSGSIVSQLTLNRLIDEYQFVVSPVLIGNGRPMMSGAAAHLVLELEDAERFPSGNVMLRYGLA